MSNVQKLIYALKTKIWFYFFVPREVSDPLRPSHLKTTPQSTPQRIPQRTSQRTPQSTPQGTPQGAPQGTPRWDSYSENPMKRSSSGSTGGTSLEDGAPPRICPQCESRGISSWASQGTPPQSTPHRTPQGTPRWDSYSENPMKRTSSGSTGGTSLEDGAPPRICPQCESRGISPWAPRSTPQRCFAGASQGASQEVPPQRDS